MDPQHQYEGGLTLRGESNMFEPSLPSAQRKSKFLVYQGKNLSADFQRDVGKMFL
jgi:hypothetical protein